MQSYTVSSAKNIRTVVGTEAAFLAALEDDAEYQPAYGVDVCDETGQTLFSTHDLANRLRDLKSEADEAGDDVQAEICARAIAGDHASVIACVKALADAAAQIE